MTSTVNHLDGFAELHVPGRPLIIVNAWDAGSAVTIAAAGATAIGTSSWAVARSHGVDDGERLSLTLVLANLRRIAERVDVPVTLDIEAGYGNATEAVAATVTRAIKSGAAGLNLEDRAPGQQDLYAIPVHVERIRAARAAASACNATTFINARTDVFLQRRVHDAKALEEALRRCDAYAEAGASGLFVPGVEDERLVARLCHRSSLPVNVMVANHDRIPQLASLGVARISFGPASYVHTLEALRILAVQALSTANAGDAPTA